MAAPDGINTLAGRIESFIAEHHLPKRRASALKKRTGGNDVTWPHAFLAAEQLAQAGFSYKPSSNNPDNVVCFICDTNLDGWEPGDDPFVEHLRHAPHCGWAVNAGISRALARGEQLREDPMGERLVGAREATFHDSWPHEGRKGWKCKTKKLVEAGWCYDPSPEYDDCVRCFYCDLSLDGWEPKDDPLDEHRRRSPQCRFFLLSEEFAGSRLATKGKKGRASRASKASRLSTQSNLTAFSEQPSLMSLGDGPAGQDESTLNAATSGIISAPKGRKTIKPTAKANRKASRTRKAPPADVSVMELNSTLPTEEAQKPQEPPKRTTRRVASRTGASQIDSTVVDSQSSQASKAKGKGRAKPRMSEDESQLHSELQAAIETSIASSNTPKVEPKTTRGTKRTSDGAPKVEASVAVLEEAPPSSLQDEKPKAKRGRKPKQPAAESQRLSDDASASASASEHALKPAPKPKKGKKLAKPTPTDPAPQPNTNTDTQMPDVEPLQEVPSNTTPLPTPSIEASPAPSTPTPAKPPTVNTSTRPIHSTPVATKPTAQTPSPHSSDAENKPPSSRPRPPLSARQGGFWGSPVKKAVASSVAWTPADLECVFLELSSAGEEETEAEKENWGDLELRGLDGDKGRGLLREIVARVRKGMSDEERGMSVEEWVRWNASRGEEALRVRCEEMVMRFEREGTRAMSVLEGIECD